MNSELLIKVANAPGIPGFEDEAQKIAVEEFTASCDEVTRDHLGNVIGFKKATLPTPGQDRPYRLMLAAHMDEIGMMVKHINDKGYIHFIRVGGIVPTVLQSSRVIIHGKKQIRGVIPVKGQCGEEPKAPSAVEDLVIDTGLSKKELEKVIAPGDPVTFDSDTAILNGKVWVGRNFDNRMGAYCLLQAMREVGQTAVDVYAVSSTQEEVGLRGARPAAFGVAPDIGIAIDGSMARMAHVADYVNLCELGKGTGIYVIDNITIGHPRLVRYLCDLCDKKKIRYQRNIGGGTDASAMQQSRAGVIATTIGAPVRYMHSTGQLCHADDMDATVALLVAFMENAHKFMAGLK
jgi:endoglucanase